MENILSKKQEKFLKSYSELSLKQRVVLENRYIQFQTYKEISKAVGVTVERCRQLESSALKLIEKYS